MTGKVYSGLQLKEYDSPGAARVLPLHRLSVSVMGRRDCDSEDLACLSASCRSVMGRRDGDSEDLACLSASGRLILVHGSLWSSAERQEVRDRPVAVRHHNKPPKKPKGKPSCNQHS